MRDALAAMVLPCSLSCSVYLKFFCSVKEKDAKGNVGMAGQRSGRQRQDGRRHDELKNKLQTVYLLQSELVLWSGYLNFLDRYCFDRSFLQQSL